MRRIHSNFSGRTATLACALALVSPIAPPRAQEAHRPIEPCEFELTIGGACTNPFVLRCPPAQFLAGMTGRSGQLLDQLTPLCIAVDAENRWIGEPAPLRTVGGAGGSPIQAVCPRDTIVSGYSGDADEHVIKVKLQCFPVLLDGSSPAAILRFGEAPTDGESSAGHLCGTGRRVVGVRGAAQEFISRFGVLCSQFLGRPPVANQPLNSVRPRVFVPQ